MLLNWQITRTLRQSTHRPPVTDNERLCARCSLAPVYFTRRHSDFYIGLYGYTWISFMNNCQQIVAKLLRITPNKLRYYQR